MRSLLLPAILALLPQAAPAEESWLGLYLQGAKVGWTRTLRTEGPQAGQKRTQSETFMQTRVLGESMKTTINSDVVSGPEGGLISYSFEMESQGRRLIVKAQARPGMISATSSAGGQETRREIPVPAGTVVIDDPLEGIEAWSKLPPKATVFDPLSLSLVEVALSPEPSRSLEGEGRAEVLRIEDPRGAMTIYRRADGGIIHIDGPLGLRMKPESREQAMNLAGSGPSDLAGASSIVPVGRVDAGASSLRFRVGGRLKGLPADGHQTVQADGDSWIVSTRPVGPKDDPGTLRVGQDGGKKAWTEPDLRIPSRDPAFVKLAKEMAGRAQLASEAAENIRLGVYRRLRVNAGIGVMRDAAEILKSGEGVCRDHAVLMCTLMRAVGIPTRLVNGIVYQDGRFYYHAWVEAWNGTRWIGYDSTRPAPRLTASHIKTVQGGMSDVMVGFLIEEPRIEVLPAVSLR